MIEFAVNVLGAKDKDWLEKLFNEQWGGTTMVVHGVSYNCLELPGFVAVLSATGEQIGLLTYSIEGDSCEIISLDSLKENLGVGTALIEAVKATAQAENCCRLSLITTNDNLHAVKFYQKRGFRLMAVHTGAVDRARLIKPTIPLLGNDAIPIHDEIKLEFSL